MATTHNIPTNAFLSQLAEVVITTDQESVSFMVKHNATEIFNNTYTPTGGVVKLYDVDKIVEPYIGDMVFGGFSFVIDGITQYTTVYRSNAKTNEGAETFVPSFWLTELQSKRITAIGRYETLTMYVTLGTYVIGHAVYYKDGELIEANVQLGQATNGQYTVDCSPKRLENADNGQLISYTVNAGERKQEYIVLASNPIADPKIIFRNGFGAWDTIYFAGKKTFAPTYARSSARIGGEFRLYDVDETVTYTAHTGNLPSSYSALIADLCQSKDVFILNADGTAGDRITITDCDLKQSNQYDEVFSATITYRYASKFTGRVDGHRPPNLFDKTFDLTFN